MNDLYLIAVVYGRRRPVGAADDSVVKLDRDAFTRQRKKLEQPIEVDLCRNLSRLAVQEY